MARPVGDTDKGGTYDSNPERGVYGDQMGTSAKNAQYAGKSDEERKLIEEFVNGRQPTPEERELAEKYLKAPPKTLAKMYKDAWGSIRDGEPFGGGGGGGIPGGPIGGGGGGGGGTGGFDQYSAYGWGNFTPQGEGQAQAFNRLGNEMYGRAAPVMPNIEIDWSGYGGGGGGGLQLPGNQMGLPPPPIRTNPTAFGGVMNPMTGMSTVIQRPPETITGDTYIPNARIGVDPTAMGGFGTAFKGFEQTQTDAAANRAPAVDAFASTNSAPSQAGRYQQDASGNWFDSWAQPPPPAPAPVDPLFGGGSVGDFGLGGDLSARLGGPAPIAVQNAYHGLRGRGL